MNADEILELYLSGAGSTNAIDAALQMVPKHFPSRALLPKGDHSGSLNHNDEKDLNRGRNTMSTAIWGQGAAAGGHDNEGMSQGQALMSPQEGDEIARVLIDQARAKLAECAPIAERIDLYAEAAEHGSAEGLYAWATLLAYGTEVSEAQCGVGQAASVTASGSGGGSGSASGGRYSSSAMAVGVSDQSRAAYALLVAAEMGSAKAVTSLAVMIFSGVGLQSILDSAALEHALWDVPVPMEIRRRGRPESDECSSVSGEST